MAIPNAVFNTVGRQPCIGKVSEYHQLAPLSGHYNRPVAFLAQNQMVTFNAAGNPAPMSNRNEVWANVQRFNTVTMATVDTIRALAEAQARPQPFD